LTLLDTFTLPTRVFSVVSYFRFNPTVKYTAIDETDPRLLEGHKAAARVYFDDPDNR